MVLNRPVVDMTQYKRRRCHLCIIFYLKSPRRKSFISAAWMAEANIFVFYECTVEEAVAAHFHQALQGMLQPWSMDVEGNLNDGSI